jgi:hypothetical protein
MGKQRYQPAEYEQVVAERGLHGRDVYRSGQRIRYFMGDSGDVLSNRQRERDRPADRYRQVRGEDN